MHSKEADLCNFMGRSLPQMNTDDTDQIRVIRVINGLVSLEEE